MKSSFELAMERLNKSSPTVKLTVEQKSQIAELESKSAAKLAERELFLKEEMAKAANASNFELIDQLEKQLVSERKSIAADLEEKKAKVRETAKSK
jgi:hypothetical protein